MHNFRSARPIFFFQGLPFSAIRLWRPSAETRTATLSVWQPLPFRVWIAFSAYVGKKDISVEKIPQRKDILKPRIN